MKLFMAVLFVSGMAFAKAKDREPASNPPEAKAAAAQMKKEVRTRISAYTVAPDEENGCAQAGLHYNIKVQVKKAVRAMGKDGNVGTKYTWETVREQDLDPEGHIMEICLE